MKILSFLFGVIVSFSITAFGYATLKPAHPGACQATPTIVNSEVINPLSQFKDPNLVYKIDSRFIHAFTKEEVHQARKIHDLVPDAKGAPSDHFASVTVAIMDDHGEQMEIENNTNGDFNQKQLKLLSTVDYSTNFYVNARFVKKNKVTGKDQEGTLQYYITAIPELEASYLDGNEKLIEYLRENTRSQVETLNRNQLRAGQFYFTITNEGKIEDVYTESSSGFLHIDQLLMNQLRNLPGKWKPAQNAKGQNVDQKLIFFFGKDGC